MKKKLKSDKIISKKIYKKNKCKVINHFEDTKKDKNILKADMHIHTNNSDGSESVKKVLKLAEKEGLDVIAITDHNTIDAHKKLEKIKISKYFSGKVIAGCEISCIFLGRPIEILGYFDSYKDFEKYLEIILEKDNEENRKKVVGCVRDFSQKNQLEFDFGIFDKLYSSLKTIYITKVIYDEIVRYKSNFDKIDNELLENFNNFIRLGISNPKNSIYIDQGHAYFSAKEVVDMIKKAGGKSFLAHAFVYNYDEEGEYKNTLSLVENLKNMTGIDGIECYHSKHNLKQTNLLLEFVKDNNLCVSGGSDFHGIPKPNVEIGKSTEGMSLNNKMLDKWFFKKLQK